jgi:hypothetical protein
MSAVYDAPAHFTKSPVFSSKLAVLQNTCGCFKTHPIHPATSDPRIPEPIRPFGIESLKPAARWKDRLKPPEKESK